MPLVPAGGVRSQVGAARDSVLDRLDDGDRAPWSLASIGLGLFAFRRVEYLESAVVEVRSDGDAPRFLRATVGVLVAMLFFGVRQLLRPPSPGRRAARRAAARRRRARDRAPGRRRPPNLVFLRDKALLWSEARTPS